MYYKQTEYSLGPELSALVHKPPCSSQTRLGGEAYQHLAADMMFSLVGRWGAVTEAFLDETSHHTKSETSMWHAHQQPGSTVASSPSFKQLKTNFFLTHVYAIIFSPQLLWFQNLSYTKTSFTLLLLHHHTRYFPPLVFIVKYLFILLNALPELWFPVNSSSLLGLNYACILFVFMLLF